MNKITRALLVLLTAGTVAGCATTKSNPCKPVQKWQYLGDSINKKMNGKSYFFHDGTQYLVEVNPCDNYSGDSRNKELRNSALDVRRGGSELIVRKTTRFGDTTYSITDRSSENGLVPDEIMVSASDKYGTPGSDITFFIEYGVDQSHYVNFEDSAKGNEKLSSKDVDELRRDALKEWKTFLALSDRQ
ncbi:hypothetical protein JXB27_03055 [Candidatus Woesearchaeota archaeon]|nr:hypothetical protein [Candidatus Woesearchaeota archaeon]